MRIDGMHVDILQLSAAAVLLNLQLQGKSDNKFKACFRNRVYELNNN